MRSWIVTVGPNQGRGSSHAHGPVTNTGPVRVVAEDDVRSLLERYYNRPDSEIELTLVQLRRGVFHDG